MNRWNCKIIILTIFIIAIFLCLEKADIVIGEEDTTGNLSKEDIEIVQELELLEELEMFEKMEVLEEEDYEAIENLDVLESEEDKDEKKTH